MEILKPSASLDTWRDYFLQRDSDIFGIIEHAIMVAATDSPEELKSRRDTIVNLLFSCQGRNNIGCDHSKLSKAGDKEAHNVSKNMEKDGAHEEDEMKLNNSQIVDEVMRIKDILLNRNDEPSMLFESLTKLASMPISVHLIKDTEIGKAVNLLRRHGSDKIRKRAKTLIEAWKEMVDQWMKMPKEVADADRTPKSTTLSIVDEAEDFPSLPDDLDFHAPEHTAFEISKILDSLDCDGNLLESVDPKNERKEQSRMMRRPDGTCEANVIGRDKKNQQMRRKEADDRPMSHSAHVLDGRDKKNQQMRRKEADVRPMRHSAHVLDEARRQPKQQMVQAIQRKPIVVVEKKWKLAESQQDKRKALDDQEAKFENAKRRLQESYQQHEKAKRQRTIQVLESIPNQRKSKRPVAVLKRPMRR